jgi:hypothetical protein
VSTSLETKRAARRPSQGSGRPKRKRGRVAEDRFGSKPKWPQPANESAVAAALSSSAQQLLEPLICRCPAVPEIKTVQLALAHHHHAHRNDSLRTPNVFRLRTLTPARRRNLECVTALTTSGVGSALCADKGQRPRRFTQRVSSAARACQRHCPRASLA